VCSAAVRAVVVVAAGAGHPWTREFSRLPAVGGPGPVSPGLSELPGAWWSWCAVGVSCCRCPFLAKNTVSSPSSAVFSAAFIIGYCLSPGMDSASKLAIHVASFMVPRIPMVKGITRPDHPGKRACRWLHSRAYRCVFCSSAMRSACRSGSYARVNSSMKKDLAFQLSNRPSGRCLSMSVTRRVWRAVGGLASGLALGMKGLRFRRALPCDTEGGGSVTAKGACFGCEGAVARPGSP
jgi:hypothetical protein